jgi:hypothetical protein
MAESTNDKRFRVKVGRYYRTRGGQIVHITARRSGFHHPYQGFFLTSLATYGTGIFSWTGGGRSEVFQIDLVEELGKDKPELPLPPPNRPIAEWL